jgi:hypothetical protein
MSRIGLLLSIWSWHKKANLKKDCMISNSALKDIQVERHLILRLLVVRPSRSLKIAVSTLSESLKFAPTVFQILLKLLRLQLLSTLQGGPPSPMSFVQIIRSIQRLLHRIHFLQEPSTRLSSTVTSTAPGRRHDLASTAIKLRLVDIAQTSSL